MTDRERWIVYPLLLMALGLALQSKITEVDARFGVVKCNRLICNEVVARRAEVVLELDASRATTRVLSTGTLNANNANVVAASCQQVDSEKLVVSDSLGARQAQIVGTTHGGRIDIDRYAVRGNVPQRNRSIETYVTDRRGIHFQLGMLHEHLVPATPPKEKAEGSPQADAKDGDEQKADAKDEDAKDAAAEPDK